MRIEINTVIKKEVYRNAGPFFFMRTNVIINDKEYNSIKAIPLEAEPDYFDYIWKELGKLVREEYIKNLGVEYEKDLGVD